ncbi:unnamed protein product, partial [Closterium sp. NIES-54]
DRPGQTCGKLHTQHPCFSRLNDAWRAEFGDEVKRSRWADRLRSGVAIFDLDFDVILSAMYALSASAEGDCYRCVPPDPGIAAAAQCVSESGTLPGTARAESLHTFTLDSGASRCFFRDSTTLTPLPAPGPVRQADPSWGLVVARSSTILFCPMVPSGSLSLPPLPPSPAPPCLPCVEGRQRAAPHSSIPPTTTPLQTLHMDMWGPARISGQGRERYILLVVDDYTQYSTVFPLRSKGEVDLPVLRLHSDRGGEFSSNLLREFCHEEGILQLFMLSDSPQQNRIAERRFGLVMEVARTSMIHAAAPHFLWPFADVTFDESVPFYRLFPYRSAPPLSSPIFLAPGPPPVDPLPPQGPAPSGVSQVDPLRGSAPVEVAAGSNAARGAASGGAAFGGAEPRGAES